MAKGNELLKRVRELEKENGLLQLAVSDLAGGIEPDHVVRVGNGKAIERWILRLFRARGAHCGIVVVTYFKRGQRPFTDVRYLDEYNLPQELLGAKYQLVNARDRLLNEGGK